MLVLLEVMRLHDSAAAKKLQYEIVVFSDMEFDEAVVTDDLDGSSEPRGTGRNGCDCEDECMHEDHSMGSLRSGSENTVDDEVDGSSDFYDCASTQGSDVLTDSSGTAQRVVDEGAVEAEWLTAFERTQQQFTDAGLQVVPIVFWNLAASVSQPVNSASFSGVIQLGGYSAALLRAFLEHDHEKFTTQAMLRDILRKPAYEMLDVV
jgi:hypothetical protein